MPTRIADECSTRIELLDRWINIEPCQSGPKRARSGSSYTTVSKQSWLSQRAPRLWLISLLLVPPLILTGCATILLPVQEGGVRVVAIETLLAMPGTAAPIANAEGVGDILQTFGGSGSSHFDHFTNVDGYVDDSNANPNAQWQFFMFFYQSSLPACAPVGPILRNGGPGGLLWGVNCIVP
jgi:hypothetical protein